MLSLDDVRAAAHRLDGVAHRTPVLRSRTLDGLAGAEVHLKAECFQRGGAFKFRGAYSLISTLDEPQRTSGVVAFSSGNHAQAVALASSLLGVQATIAMPEDAPALKLEATRGYGAQVVLYDRYTDDRAAIAQRLADERGAVVVPPYDHELIMAGQGTAALELLDDAGPLDTLLAPVGGGGLVAGCATVAAALQPGLRVIGVEPEAGDDTRRSLEAGRRVEIPVPRTIADGQQITAPGELTFPIVQRLVSEVVLVSDGELLDAMRFAFDRLKIVLEPSGACGLAALLAGRIAPGGRCGVILSGGNVGLERFAELYRS
jgi:threo-3-hydroxy-L-aspartate ammonia-lyase